MKKGYVIFDSNGAIKDRKSLKLVATSSGVDTLYVFADFDVSTIETAYRATVRVEKANGVITGPHLLTLSQITEEEKAEFGVDYLACRKLEIKDKMLNVPGRLMLTIVYDQVDVNGKVLRTAAQGRLDEYVYEAVPEVPGEEEINDIRAEFMPRDLGDMTIADEFKDTDNIVVTQDGTTKKITGAELKEKFIKNIIDDTMIESMVESDIENKVTQLYDEKEQQYAPRLNSLEVNKADRTEVQAVASGSPKGVFATLVDLQTAFPTGAEGIYVLDEDGGWYYWDGSVWKYGGQYQSTGIADNSITGGKLNVINVNKTLKLNDIESYEKRLRKNYFYNFDASKPLSTAEFSKSKYFDSLVEVGTYIENGSFVIPASGYFFIKWKLIDDIIAGNKINLLINIPSKPFETLINYTFSNISGADLINFERITNSDWYIAYDVIIPEGKTTIQIRIDNRNNASSIIFKYPLIVKNLNDIPFITVDEKVLELEDSVNIALQNEYELYSNPMLKNTSGFYTTQSEIEITKEVNGIKIVKSIDTSVLLAMFTDIHIPTFYENGKSIKINVSLLNIPSISTTSIYVIPYDATEVEIANNRLRIYPKVGDNIYNYLPPVGTEKLKLRFDLGITEPVGSHYLVSKISCTYLSNVNMYATKDDNLINNVIGSSVSYVTLTGNDNNSGTSPINGYATLQKALNSGAEIIYIERGNYYNQGDISYNGNKIKILPLDKKYINGQPLQKIRFVGSDVLSANWIEHSANVYKQAYEGNTYWNKVFIDKTLPVDTGGSRPSYNAILWEGNDRINDLKLKPVLTLEECESTEKSFFYDGINVYVHPTNGTVGNKEFNAVKLSTGIALSNSGDVVLQDIVFDYYMGVPFYLQNIKNIFAQNCEAGHSGTGDGFSLDYSNGRFEHCAAYKNRNDGFNIHYAGQTEFINCEGYYNYDDGISHHEVCTGTIIGGNWYGNGKGGIIPVNAAKVEVIGAYCWNNSVYGICFTSSGLSSKQTLVTINSCVCTGNGQGIYIGQYYKALIANCVIKNNKENGIKCDDDGVIEVDSCILTDNIQAGLLNNSTNSSILKDSKISDNSIGIKLTNGLLKLSRNNIVYNATGIDGNIGVITIEKRNNLFGNSMNYNGSQPVQSEKDKNVSFQIV